VSPVEQLQNEPIDEPVVDAPEVIEAAAVSEVPEAFVDKQLVQAETVAKVVPPPPTTAPILSSNAFASSASTNGANVMTGRSTSRVLAPPGGKCSITLGV
jgi:hypothetical protein